MVRETVLDSGGLFYLRRFESLHCWFVLLSARFGIEEAG